MIYSPVYLKQKEDWPLDNCCVGIREKPTQLPVVIFVIAPQGVLAALEGDDDIKSDIES